MMLGSMLLIPVYLVMAYLHSVRHVILHIPLFGTWDLPLLLLGVMAVMGIAFSLIPAVMWPSVVYIVDPGKLGTAYGLMTMIQNMGLAGFNLMIGWANDYSNASAAHPQGYHLGMWIFSLCGFFGLFFAFMLRRNEMGPHSHGLEFGTKYNKKPAN